MIATDMYGKSPYWSGYRELRVKPFYNFCLGTNHKVRMLKFGDFQTHLPIERF